LILLAPARSRLPLTVRRLRKEPPASLERGSNDWEELPPGPGVLDVESVYEEETRFVAGHFICCAGVKIKYR
jgi:hypothetical protein